MTGGASGVIAMAGGARGVEAIVVGKVNACRE